MSEEVMSDEVVSGSEIRTFLLGDFELESGVILTDAKIVYKTFGKLNANRDNVILYPTWFNGQDKDNEWLIGDDKALNPGKYFIVVPNMFGNGLSTSPSNRPDLVEGSGFPSITPYDNVTAQHKLLTEALGVRELALVIGWSMAAQQAYHWGAIYPQMVKRMLPFCGSAKTAPHNWVFLDGVRAVLSLGQYDTQGPQRALQAAGRDYAGWAFSQMFYQEEEWRKIGFTSLESFINDFWNYFFIAKDPNDLLAMIDTWQRADISNNSLYKGDINKALQSITAKTLLMPSSTDLYFTAADSRREMQSLLNAKYIELESIWGHAAGAGLNAKDIEFINGAVVQLLAS